MKEPKSKINQASRKITLIIILMNKLFSTLQLIIITTNKGNHLKSLARTFLCDKTKIMFKNNNSILIHITLSIKLETLSN